MKPPTRMGMAMSGRCGAWAISRASSFTRAAISSLLKRISGIASVMRHEPDFQMTGGGGRSGKPREERRRLARLQGLYIGREIPVIDFVILVVAQSHADILRHGQFARTGIDDIAGDHQH